MSEGLASAHGRREPTPRNVLKPDEIQLLAMALAHLAIERPGWHHMTRTFADERLEVVDLFDRFLALRRAHVATAGPADSIQAVRRAVQAVNPLLWEMVREICWPGEGPL